MNKVFGILLVGLSLISFPSWSGDLSKALAALQSGDYETALRKLTPLAEQGDAVAQRFLGLIYDHENGVPKDYKAAVK